MADHGYSPFELRDVEEWISRPDLVREAIGDPSRIPDAFWTDLRRGAHWRPSLRRGPGRRFWLQTATAPLACAVLPSGKWHLGFYQAAEGHRADLGSSAGLPAPPAAIACCSPFWPGTRRFPSTGFCSTAGGASSHSMGQACRDGGTRLPAPSPRSRAANRSLRIPRGMGNPPQRRCALRPGTRPRLPAPAGRMKA